MPQRVKKGAGVHAVKILPTAGIGVTECDLSWGGRSHYFRTWFHYDGWSFVADETNVTCPVCSKVAYVAC